MGWQAARPCADTGALPAIPSHACALSKRKVPDFFDDVVSLIERGRRFRGIVSRPLGGGAVGLGFYTILPLPI